MTFYYNLWIIDTVSLPSLVFFFFLQVNMSNDSLVGVAEKELKLGKTKSKISWFVFVMLGMNARNDLRK